MQLLIRATVLNHKSLYSYLLQCRISPRTLSYSQLNIFKRYYKLGNSFWSHGLKRLPALGPLFAECMYSLTDHKVYADPSRTANSPLVTGLVFPCYPSQSPHGAKALTVSQVGMTIDMGDGLLYRNNTLKLLPRKTSMSWQQLSWQLSLLAEHGGHWSVEINLWVVFSLRPEWLRNRIGTSPPFGFPLIPCIDRKLSPVTEVIWMVMEFASWTQIWDILITTHINRHYPFKHHCFFFFFLLF